MARLISPLRKSFNPEQPRGQPENAGQFGPGGNASKAPKHGEHAQRLADAGRKLKESMAAHREERKAVFNDLKQHAHAAAAKETEAVSRANAALYDARFFDDYEGNEEMLAYGYFEDYLNGYQDGAPADRLERLKEIERVAKEVMGARGISDEGTSLSDEEAADLKSRMRIIADSAREARQHLREQIRYRREMAAIKRGEAKGIHGTIRK